MCHAFNTGKIAKDVFQRRGMPGWEAPSWHPTVPPFCYWTHCSCYNHQDHHSMGDTCRCSRCNHSVAVGQVLSLLRAKSKKPWEQKFKPFPDLFFWYHCRSGHDQGLPEGNKLRKWVLQVRSPPFSMIFHNRPFYRYGGHIKLIRFKEYYRMPRGAWTRSVVLA